MEIAVQQYW